ncbi:MAG: hypothetical protein DWQ01_11890 [Planctomycetota bacterium]|nr:MAG: hypothetical protein DWQ01_11890 [Planctomycetota bacterium]
MQPQHATAKDKAKRSRFRWSFPKAMLGILFLALWTEVMVTLATKANVETGSSKWPYAIGFFFSVLPLLALAVYRWPLVFSFFRSVKVGVTNLIFIGLAAILGVLFHQEDPNFPIPKGGVEQLAEWESQEGPWSYEARMAYRNYLDFRGAQATFVYHMLEGRGLGLLGFDASVDYQFVDTQMEELRPKLPPIERRYGEEFAKSLEASSERGWLTRQENADIKRLETAWDDTWFTLFVWADRLDLIRTYKADWFASLWVILLFGVFSNTFRGGWRRLLRPNKWGFVITHAGVILVILGGFHSRLTERRGMLNIRRGESKAVFQLYSGKKHAFVRPGLFGETEETPFVVRLDGFRADYHDVLDVVYVKQEGDSFEREFAVRNPVHRIYEGKVLRFDYGDSKDHPEGGGGKRPFLQIEVLEYLPQCEEEFFLREASEEEEGTIPVVAHAKLFQEEVLLQETLMQPLAIHPRALLLDERTGARIRLRVAPDEEAARRTLAKPVELNFGHVRAMVGDSPVGPMMQAVPGEETKLEVRDQVYRVTIKDAVPDLRLRTLADGRAVHDPSGVPMELLIPVNPAVLVSIENQAGEVEERWVLEKDFHGPEPKFAELEFRFLWDWWAFPAKTRYLLFLLPDGNLRFGEVGKPESLQPFAQDGEFELGDGVRFQLAGAFSYGKVETKVKVVEGADFFHPAPGAVRIRTTTPEGQQEMTLVATEKGDARPLRYTGPGGETRLVSISFRLDQNELPKEWRSKLSFLEAPGADGHELKERYSGEIRVNDYLYYKGYRFFQTNADANDPDYSGVGVVYDPGIEAVLTGLYMVAGGTMIAFLINPLVFRNRRRRTA